MENLPATFSASKLPAAFKDAPAGDELAAGITGGFAIMSYRGKVWSTKYLGVETQLLREDGDGARASIEVIIIKAAAPIAKIFYKKGFVEGSNAPPDCWSTNGQYPDAGSPEKQSPTCAGCPQNAFGSKITEAGKQTKACADSKRLAIVPMADPENEILGGPMLLRVPAASLREIKTYADEMKAYGFPYFAVATRISFDTNEAFPKFIFKPIRPLTEEEAQKVMLLRDDPRVNRILNEAIEHVTAPTGPNFEQGGTEAKPAESMFGGKTTAPLGAGAPTAAKPVTTPQTAETPAPAPAPVDEVAELKAKLAALEAAQKKPKTPPKPKPKTEVELLKEKLAAAEAAASTPASTTANAEPAGETAAAEDTGAGVPADLEAELDKLLG